MSNFDIAIKSATKNYKKAIKELEQTGKVDEQALANLKKMNVLSREFRDEFIRISDFSDFSHTSRPDSLW